MQPQNKYITLDGQTDKETSTYRPMDQILFNYRQNLYRQYLQLVDYKLDSLHF